MSSLSGKTGLIVGIANKRSIAWAIAQAASSAGARLAVTYQGERLGENVRELAEGLPDPLLLPLDVTDDAQIAAVFEGIDQKFGGLDFLVHGVAFATRDDLSNPFVQTSRDGFKTALDVGVSLIALARGAAAHGAARRRQHPDAHVLGSERVSGNTTMGSPGALESTVRYRRPTRAEEHPKRDLGGDQDAGGVRRPGFSSCKDRAPLRRCVDVGGRRRRCSC
jgi:enoyl-[acyl-carrier protein] reductase I